MWHDRDNGTQKYHVAIVIGRFQPVHNGHVALFKAAAEIAHTVLVLVGSSNIARDSKNPFTFAERKIMIEDNFPHTNIQKTNLAIEPIVDDLYNEQRWYSDVQAAVQKTVTDRGWDPKKVVLVGHQKKSFATHVLNDARRTWELPER